MKVSLLLQHIDQTQKSTQTNLKCNNKNFKIILPGIIPLLSISNQIQIQNKYQQIVEILAKQNKSAQLSHQNSQKIQGQYSVIRAMQIINFSKKYFNRIIKIDITVLAVNYFVSDMDKKIQPIQSSDLDKLPLSTIIKLYKNGIDLLSQKLKSRVSRLLKKYINQTKRSNNQKSALNDLHKSLKYLKKQQQNQDDWADVQQVSQGNISNHKKSIETQKQDALMFRNQLKQNSNKIKHKHHHKETFQTQKSSQGQQSFVKKERISKKITESKPESRSKIEQVQSDDQKNSPIAKQEQKRKDRKSMRNSRQNRRGNSFQKQSFSDDRILLGIKGDSLTGWRERYRPQKYPKVQLIQIKRQKISSIRSKKTQQTLKSTQNTPNKQKQKIKVVKQFKMVEQKKKEPKTLEMVYNYPQMKNKSFTFKLNTGYKIKVNNLFWINIEPDDNRVTIVLVDSSKGFIRSGKIQLIDQGHGFMVQGLNFSFNSICNMEDGGVSFGNATVQDFIPTGKQWFVLQNVQIFTYQ